MKEIDDDTLDNTMSDYVNVVSEDVEGPDKEPAAAIDVFAQQTRSFAEARDMVRRMRVSRGHYPISRSPAFEPGRFKGKGRGKRGMNNNKKSNVKGETKDNRPSLCEGKGKDSWSKSSSWRPWSSENRKGPPQRDEDDKSRGAHLRKKHDDPMDFDGTVSPRWVRGGPIGPLRLMFNLQRNLPCVETRTE